MKSYIEKIKEIQDELKWDPELFEAEIHIEMDNGIATLTGFVENEKKKKIAGKIAGNVDGVKSVVNELQISSQHKQHKAQEVPSPNSGDPDNTLKVSGA